MFSIYLPHRLLILSVLLSPFLLYFTSSSTFSYAPIVLCLLIVVFSEFMYMSKMAGKYWWAVLSWIPYASLASFYYILNPLGGRYLTAHFFVALSLPIIVLCITRLMNCIGYRDYCEFVIKIILFFLSSQIFICLAQILFLSTGVGLAPRNELYSESYMITGTFVNSNDLASVVLLTSFIYVSIGSYSSKFQQVVVWLMITFLLFLTGSRSAIVLTLIIFLVGRGFGLKSIFYFGVALFLLFAAYSGLSGIDSDILSRVFLRVDSIYNIIFGGIESDGSMSIRLNSYVHFINNLSVLGFGSGELGNYSTYAKGGNFSSDFIFTNPHSFIVETGYWLGWCGLLFLIIGISGVLGFSSRRLQVIVLFVIATAISSSVLGNFIFFLFLFFCFFDFQLSTDKKTSNPV